ncbi:sensor histidine kinase [Streptomyces sennicomposti]|uniref:sensor histidine kinase n=1 Tax=Streptomyces sennicomposti TaxID=2873384 RepID=UPI001CA634DF|nr:sensor histidine kinase [Streptomyces sennicomposti]MBY8866796.1 HAMP domain-containing protein [Streptomyces sennicomposti]
MSTSQVDAPDRPAPPPTPPGSRGIRGFADRWPFRRKLNVLVGVPLAVVALLLAYLITDQVGQARDAAAAAQLVRDSAQVAALVDRVEAEHQQAVLLSVRYEAAGADGRPSPVAYRRAQTAVDAQVAAVREAFGDRLPDTEAQALKEIEGLSSLRDTIEQSYLPADNIDPAYTGAARSLIDGLGLDRNAALAATFTGNLLDSLLRADAAHSSFETSVFSATTGDTNALIEFTAAVGSYDLYLHQADRFARFATEEQADRLSEMEHSAAQREIAEAYAELQIDPSGLQANSREEVRRTFQAALAGYRAYPEQAANRLKIASSLIDEIADSADDASSDAWWRAAALLASALVGFLLWLAFSVAVRRSVIRPVQALTGAAQEVSAATSRELARVADDDADDGGPPRLRDVPVTARDEIGDLAEAFNQVQTTAAALLERQVLSRRNIGEMFGNVGRRVSNLTTRQLALIDAVERGETDPALLERLYSIDHIAVRLRRNADSLMLLAGIRETVLDSGPTALTNVVRAALGQIEGYQRVRLYAETEVMVEPDIIGDLTLMVAELLENAVSFSPEGSTVEVSVRHGGEGASIAIADHGLGMSAERLAEENARLIRRERLDVVPTKVLGLFVVGALARRWEVGVTLSRTPGGGVTAEVLIPSSLLLTMSALDAAGPAARPESAGRGAADRPAPGATDRPASATTVASATAEASAASPLAPSPAAAETAAKSPAPSDSATPQAGASGLVVAASAGSVTAEASATSPAASGSAAPSRAVPVAARAAGTDPAEADSAPPLAGASSPAVPTAVVEAGTADSGAGTPPAQSPAGPRPASPSAATANPDVSEPAAPTTAATPDPTASAAAADEHARVGDGDGQARPLPRRVPRRETAPEEGVGVPGGPLPFIPRARTESIPSGTTTVTAPGTTHGAVPGTTRDTAPGLASGTTPAAAHGTASDTTPDGTPGVASGAAPGTNPGHAPGLASGAAPGSLPGTAPGGTPRTTPGTPSGTAPSHVPGTTPGTAPSPVPSTAPGTAPGAGPSSAPGAAAGSRPLRRRVRGATLRTAADSAAAQAARAPVPQADADAVRSALEEFEAAVERAHRDTGAHRRPEPPGASDAAPTDTPRTQHRNDLPEGAEQ